MKKQVEILVVEDSMTQALRLKHLLQKNNYRVRIACDGVKGLAAVKEKKPTIIVTDVIMPNMDGFQLCRKVKDDMHLRDIPVLILTSLSDPNDVIKGLESGADNFLTKPYEDEHLLQRIYHILTNMELRKVGEDESPLEVFFAGQKYKLSSERMQIIDLLLSTFEEAMLQKTQLEKINEDYRRALGEINRAHLNFRKMMETIGDAIIVVDDAKTVRYVNPAFEILFQQEAADFLQKPFEFPVEEGRPKEIVIKRGEGDISIGEMHVVSSHWDGEEVLMATIRDITQRKEADERDRRHLQFQRLVAKISSSFVKVSSKDREDTIYNALKACGEFFGLDRSYVLLFSSKEGIIRKTYEWCLSGLKGYAFHLLDQELEKLPWLKRQIEKEEILHVPDVKDPSIKGVEKWDLELRLAQSFLSIPVIISQDLISFFCFDCVHKKKTWTYEEISFVKIIVEIISNVFLREQKEQKIKEYTREIELQSRELNLIYRKLDLEIDKAQKVHESSLLKTLPSYVGLTIKAHYQPALKLGGDFYFCDQVKGNKLLMYLSDVTGHGLAGAMLSFFVKSTINAYLSIAKEEDMSLEKILWFLYKQYQKEKYPDDYIICIFLALLDLETLELSYLGAGFQDIPLLKRGREEMGLNNSGLPISSVIPANLLNFKAKTLPLIPSSTLFFYTDGLTEQEVDGTMYGKRVKEVFFQKSTLSPPLLVNAINDDFKVFNKGSLQGDDDITFLLVHIHETYEKGKALQGVDQLTVRGH